MKSSVYDDRISTLAEGVLWHPERQQLFWLDILGGNLHTRDAHGRKTWPLGEFGSAAGWIDDAHLLIATETGLWRFSIETGEREKIADIEANKPDMRSNDGRADPWGGFWIGTMSKSKVAGAGAIYRYFKGEVRQLFGGLSIPNAISFAPDRSRATYTDTTTGKVMTVALDAETGWPVGEPSIYLDLSVDGLNPDGAVFDADGFFWVALWGASRVNAYDAAGQLVKSVSVWVPQVTCPAFGGPDFSTLYITTAREGMDIHGIAKAPESGMVFRVPGVARGLPEPRVIV